MLFSVLILTGLFIVSISHCLKVNIISDVSNQETNTPPISHSQSPLQQDSNEAGPANESSNKKATTLKMIPPEANNCFCEDIDNEGITGEGTEIPDDTHHNRITEKCTTCDLKPGMNSMFLLSRYTYSLLLICVC